MLEYDVELILVPVLVVVLVLVLYIYIYIYIFNLYQVMLCYSSNITFYLCVYYCILR